MRGVHSGSADIGAAYGTPIAAARGGRVTSAAWSEIGGYLVIIDHGDDYSTLYSHLMNVPAVAVGDRVTAGQRLGVLGRTGNAFSNGAHLHFSIRRGTERLVIPGLEYGAWVRRGQPIAGTYGSLSTFRAVAPAFDLEIVDDGVPAFASPSQSAVILDMLSAGEVLRATRSEDGYYRVTLDSGRHGWVVHTATTPRGVNIDGVRITAMEANVRRTPSVSGAQLGTISNGELVTTFEQRGEWFRLLFGLPTVYGWTHETNVAATVQHRASIRAPSANLRSAPSITSPSVGSLSFTSSFVVLERRHGWYRLRRDGADVWVAGWLTGGRL
ncbi:MAG: SH3 domain-containing protein [Myxococcota bacterium]|nr:SH3 domain-containing protein [Myxococcota bacterium]